MQDRLDKKIQALKQELEDVKREHKREVFNLNINIDERDERIKILLNTMKSDESRRQVQEEVQADLVSESEFKGDLETVKGKLREAKLKIKRLNRELDEKVARINELEDNVMGHVEDKRCKVFN